MPTPIEPDVPPGSPAYAYGPLANRAPTVGGFLASGQRDVGQYLTPPGAVPQQPTGASPAPSIPQSFIDRAHAGILNLFGLTPTPPPAPVAVTDNRTASLEAGLNDLERRSTVPATTILQQRLSAQNK